MCGIAGFLNPRGLATSSAEELAGALATRLLHRGPDDQGVWVDGGAGIALAHRRLSVVDLSLAGRQPMKSASDRYVIAFNGEIYNHQDLRQELKESGFPCAWRGHSDTETLLAAFDCWGIEPTLRKTVGMFALSLWDRHQRILTLARDRLGEKPLYYGWQGEVFLFGSELKALRAHPAFLGAIDRSAVALYFQYGYVPAPASIYHNVMKLMPGAYIQISVETPCNTLPEPRSYWSLRQVIERGAAAQFAPSDAVAVEELEVHLKQAISSQQMADVPLGAFLSGGIDSSLVVAIMQADTSRAVKTYTLGFCRPGFDEARHAQAVAHHLGTEHTELYVTSREALEVIPRLPAIYDEPFGDNSAIPTFLVSSLARRHVTVALSGDGGDELFGGYTRYHRTVDIWRMVNRIPYRARLAAAGGIRRWQRSRYTSSANVQFGRAALYLSATSLDQCYDAQVSHWWGEQDLVLGGHIAPRKDALAYPSSSSGHQFEQMMYADTLRYLPDDILTKVDRASMAVSLEVRVPMLDHRVVEFAWSLPLKMKVRNGQGKWLLKQLLRKYLPDKMIERPKMGFGVPIGHWLRGPLRGWGEDLLAEQRLRVEGFLNPEVVRRCWQRHVNSNRGESDALWQILAFQAWVAEAA